MDRKVAVVTGGTRGIGEGIVRRLVESGYYVYFSFFNKSQDLERLNNLYGRQSVRPFFWDGSDLSGINDVLEEIKESGDILAVLVNNAGITRDNYFAMMSEPEMTEVIDVNLLGTMKLTRAAVRVLVSQKSGVIINISSISGILGAAGQANYSAAKAGLMSFTKALARELGRYGVRVVCVAPGFIETGMYSKIPIVQRKKMIEEVPLGRPGTAEEVAEVVEFLSSDRARYITGTTIVVDGGVI